MDISGRVNIIDRKNIRGKVSYQQDTEESGTQIITEAVNSSATLNTTRTVAVSRRVIISGTVNISGGK